MSVASLNAEFDSFHLENEANPRWVAKPAVAYLWARTGAVRRLPGGGPAAQDALAVQDGEEARAAHDGATGGRRRCRLRHRAGRSRGQRKRRAEARARPEPGRRHDERERREVSLLRRDRHDEGYSHRGARAGRIGERMTAVVVDGQEGKEYRLPTEVEMEAACVTEEALDRLYKEIPFGLPGEPVSPDRPSPNSRGASGLPRYGFGTWRQLFTNRQLLALGTFVREIRRNADLMSGRAVLGHHSESSELPPSQDPGFDADRLVAVDADRPAMQERRVSWERGRSTCNDSRDGTPDAYGRGGTSEPDAGNRDGIPKADVGSWERGRPDRKEDAGQQRIHAGGTPAFLRVRRAFGPGPSVRCGCGRDARVSQGIRRSRSCRTGPRAQADPVA